MKKNYIISALVFAILGLLAGVYFREFTKALQLEGVYTSLSFSHVHFLALGTVGLLIFGLVTDHLHVDSKLLKPAFITYVVGVFGSGSLSIARGTLDVLWKAKPHEFEISSGVNATISGLSGVFHVVFAVGIVLYFIAWIKQAKKNEQK